MLAAGKVRPASSWSPAAVNVVGHAEERRREESLDDPLHLSPLQSSLIVAVPFEMADVDVTAAAEVRRARDATAAAAIAPVAAAAVDRRRLTHR